MLGYLPPMCKTRMEFLTPSFSLTPCGEGASGWKSVASFSHCNSATQIKQSLQDTNKSGRNDNW